MITGKYLRKIGRSRGMIIGMLLVIAGITGLGTLDFVYSKTYFLFFSFTFKVFCGVGAGLNSTSSMAIVATVYKDERDKAIGKIGAATGIGLLVGPLIGSVLYSIGGYMLPFFTVSLCFFLLYPLIVHTLAQLKIREEK